jgi:ATP-dependent DNA ligase
LENLDKLSSRELTGNKAKAHLTEILENLTAGDAEVITRVIGGDLRCGVSTSTVNKVYGKGFIETYPCMLAGAYNQKNFKHIKYPAMVQLKMDGMRANIIITPDGTVDIRSRNGKQIELHGLFDDYIKEIFYTKPTLESLDSFRGSVVDGELIVLGEDLVTILDRKTGNGILNKAVKGTITKEEAKRVRMIAWDLIPLNDFKNSVCNIPYFDRIGVLQIRMSEVSNSQPIELIRSIDSIPVDNIEQANELFKRALDNGEEGIILKNGDSIWEDKRSKNQVKFKAELDIDLIITEWKEGSGRLEGKMGSVLAETSDGLLEVSIGSGFNDEDRELLPEDVVGKIIAVKYNEVIRDKNKGKASLFLPIYQELRQDKTTADKIPNG